MLEKQTLIRSRSEVLDDIKKSLLASIDVSAIGELKVRSKCCRGTCILDLCPDQTTTGRTSKRKSIAFVLLLATNRHWKLMNAPMGSQRTSTTRQ